MRKLIVLLFILLIFTSCKTQPVVQIEFIEPEFEIDSIIIIQADLVNTLFETVLKIDNQNEYELQLNRIQYELYGNGMFWARGTLNDVYIIPEKSVSEIKFMFTMNFINMSRQLLNDVIDMRKVNYIFKGNAEIKVDVQRIQSYMVEFNISGLSDVKPKAD